MLHLVEQSPVGPLWLESDGECLTGLSFQPLAGEPGDCPLLREAEKQLGEYFAGERRQFDLPLHFGGTDFQNAVWQALGDIPYGETVSYGELARRIGRPKSCRAVGGAVHRNPIAILLPCHRVIASDGSLGGFGGGLERKRILLALERK